MNQLAEIFENESQEKAYFIFVTVALKMVEKIYVNLPKTIQQIADDAREYWTNKQQEHLTEAHLKQHDLFISKLRMKNPKRYEIDQNLDLKLVQLVLMPSIQENYFDYYLDWMYEVGNRLGFTNQQLEALIEETIAADSRKL